MRDRRAGKAGHKNESRYAGPTQAVSSLTGTQSVIFPFKRISSTAGLKERALPARGPGLSIKSLASIFYLASTSRALLKGGL